MFESAEVGHKLDKKTYAAEEPKLRDALLKAQIALLQNAGFPVVILVSGVDGAGKGETVNLLNEWMDPRHIQTIAFDDPTDEERARPPMWRYWRALPPKGKIGVFFGSWYTQPLIDRVNKKLSAAELDLYIDDILDFEAMLAAEGAVVIKLWFHLSKDVQEKRLKALQKSPKTRWRVTDVDWKRFKQYDRFRKHATHVLQRTSTGHAPWTIIEGGDEAYRSIAAGQTILDRINAQLSRKSVHESRVTAAKSARMPDAKTVLSAMDLSKTMSGKDYDRQLEKWQGKLNLLCRDPRFARQSLIVVFEGMDAAGKGGAIRRITGALDARQYRVVPVAAPTDEERAQPYMWRFWRHVPRRGRVAIFDRSWYGRVLVERVEGFCSEADWMRAYGELNRFESELSEHGAVVVKFWLQVSPDEQLRRFKEREQVDYKRFKITPEDWRNRKKLPAYEIAAGDMIERTSSDIAPWTLVEADDKQYARIKILKTLCERLEQALKKQAV